MGSGISTTGDTPKLEIPVTHGVPTLAGVDLADGKKLFVKINNQTFAVTETDGVVSATAIPKKTPDTWNEAEVRSVLQVFSVYGDTDGSGFIDQKELDALCVVLMIDPVKLEDLDTGKKDGKIDRKEFFAFYEGCSSAEAAETFDKHKDLFAKKDGGAALGTALARRRARASRC